MQIRGLFLFFGFVIASFFPFFSLYLRDYHGLDAAQIGTVLLVAGALRAIANPIWGHQAGHAPGPAHGPADRAGRIRGSRRCG